MYLDGKKHEEIADIWGISKTNVATKISSLKIKLSKEFNKIMEINELEQLVKKRNQKSNRIVNEEYNSLFGYFLAQMRRKSKCYSKRF